VGKAWRLFTAMSTHLMPNVSRLWDSERSPDDNRVGEADQRCASGYELVSIERNLPHRQCQPAIELIGERLSVFGVEVCRPAGDLISSAQLIEEIPIG